MPLTKEQWVAVESELKRYLGTVIFRYQDTLITAVRSGSGEGKSVICVYFNNKMMAGWGTKDSDSYNPLTDLFWWKRTKARYKPASVVKLIKKIGKRTAKKEIPDLHEKYDYCVPFFNRASTLVRQYRKIDGLELQQLGWVKVQEEHHDA
ncbi:hypothetical protein [Morganella morganii]|uniref:hypothetical protein n=1 Tax=Morganella morganii TaxID=582 RepID=UPI0032DBA68B